MYRTELYHHGIKGQRWGVRRYQNYDGSYTRAGNARRDNSDRRKDVAKKVAKGVAAAALIGAAAYGLKNDSIRNAIIKKATDPKIVDFIKRTGTKTVKSLGDSAAKAGKAMSDAALMSVGTIGISRIAKKLEPTEGMSENEKDVNKVILDASTAGIKSITKANSNSNNNSKNTNMTGKDVTEKIGSPSNKGIDKSSSEYQSLFKDSNGNQRSPEERSTIKALANNGYDIEQIKKYLEHNYKSINELYHCNTKGTWIIRRI